MMIACVYFLVTDGMFSYPGFVAIEVMVVSSVVTVLMLLDAVSILRCKVIGKAKTNNAIKVASGVDYESDDDANLKRILRRKAAKT
jgi:competence protein ComGC